MLILERLKFLLSYDRNTGEFFWIKPTRNKKKNAAAGFDRGKGYRSIEIDGRTYRSQRLVWFYEYGYWPINQIDHINGNRADNRIENLREATNSQNRANSKRQKNNQSGYKGVKRSGDKWMARIRKNRQLIYLGLFETAASAHAAYAAAAQELHGDFARPS